MPKPNQDLPGKEGKVPSKEERREEGTYVKPGSSISPGAHPGTIAPTEDPRDDAGLNEEDPAPEQQPKKK